MRVSRIAGWLEGWIRAGIPEWNAPERGCSSGTSDSRRIP